MSHVEAAGEARAGGSARPLGAVLDDVVARAAPPAWGPWAPGLDQVEKVARLRSLAALVRVMAGPDHAPLVALLRKAEADDNALADARGAVDRLAPLTFRRVASTWGAVNLPGGGR